MLSQVAILTDTSSDQHSNLNVEHILRGRTERTVNAHLREGKSAAGVELNKVSASRTNFLVLLRALDSSRSHRGDDRWADTETVTKSTREITDLSDVHGNIGILGCRSDGELEETNQNQKRAKMQSSYRVPLEAGDFGNLDEEPLPGSVLEAGFDDAQFHRTWR